MASSLASTLGRKALCPPTLIPRKKTIKAMLPLLQHRSIEEKRKKTLPHPARLLPHHGLPHLAGEGRRKLGHIRHHTVDAVLGRRVRIGDGADTLVLIALVLASPLREPDKEALLRLHTVHRLKLLVAGGVFPGHIGQNLTAQIGH